MSDTKTIFICAEHLKQLAYGEVKCGHVVLDGELVLLRREDAPLPKTELAAINFVRTLHEVHP